MKDFMKMMQTEEGIERLKQPLGSHMRKEKHMTQKQIAALRRILDREAAAYQALSGRPAPGQHPSENKYAISDGDICVLLDALVPELPLSVRADSLARFVQNERKREAHFLVPESQIDRSYWLKQIGRCGDRTHGVELSASILHPDQMLFDDAEATEAPTEVIGKFDPQLLVDAIDAVDDSPLFFLGHGLLNGHYPPLLVMPPLWTEFNCGNPLALVLPFKYD